MTSNSILTPGGNVLYDAESFAPLYWMPIFDLVFLTAVLATAAALTGVVLLAARGHFRRAIRVLATYAIAAGVYMIIGVVVSLVKPQRVVDRGVPWCFDDWCLTAQ